MKRLILITVTFLLLTTPARARDVYVMKIRATGAGPVFAGSPTPGTFHVVCGAAVKDDVLSAINGAPVVFEADAAVSSNTYSWGFSDGSTDVGHQVTHVFSLGGRQAVTLDVTDPQGHHVAGSGQTVQVLGVGSGPNPLVITGAGFTGSWDTEIVLGNPFDSDLTVLLFIKGGETVGCVPDPCPPPFPKFVTISANAQTILHYSELFPPGLTGVYVFSEDLLLRLPVVRARAFSSSQPSRAMELPIVAYETLVSRPPGPLVFVGGLKSSVSHSNLFLSETSNLLDSGSLVRIEAIDSTGHTVGSIERSIPAGGTALVFDVAGSMGIAEFDGQVRVTQIGGSGIIDGALATLTNDGGFAVSAGFNP